MSDLFDAAFQHLEAEFYLNGEKLDARRLLADDPAAFFAAFPPKSDYLFAQEHFRAYKKTHKLVIRNKTIVLEAI